MTSQVGFYSSVRYAMLLLSVLRSHGELVRNVNAIERVLCRC
jgi:hypothetical protein